MKRLLACLAIFALVMQSSAPAVDLTWKGTAGLLVFDTASNWDPEQTPTGADDLLFDIDTDGREPHLGQRDEPLLRHAV